jgi:hypothetical protein
MATKTRLDKAINGLSEIVQRNKRQDKVRVSSDKMIIDNSSPQIGAILLISLILLLPVGLILYYILSDNSSSIVFWSLLLEIIFVNDFYKLLRGNTTFTIDFNQRYIQAESSLTRLRQIFTTKTIPFSEIREVVLKEKSISWQQQWFQLAVYDKENKTIALTDFSKVYPESIIADKVKFLIEVIIWAEKQNKARVA